MNLYVSLERKEYLDGSAVESPWLVPWVGLILHLGSNRARVAKTTVDGKRWYASEKLFNLSEDELACLRHAWPAVKAWTVHQDESVRFMERHPKAKRSEYPVMADWIRSRLYDTLIQWHKLVDQRYALGVQGDLACEYKPARSAAQAEMFAMAAADEEPPF